MGGFKNETVNVSFDNGVIAAIIGHLTKCSKQMKADCIKNSDLLKNNEDMITNRLVARYLNAEPDNYRYEIQSPENFDGKTDQYIGRADIRVISNDYFRDSHAYIVIECKRIDGGAALNKKYVTDGVARFVSHPQKYSAYHNQNIMFGYVVKTIDVFANAGKIDTLQRSLLDGVTVTEFVLLQKHDSQYLVYACEYISGYIERIELKHLFYDFACVIQ